jgi:SagB-type dehydrogenase family enzyme
MEYEGIGEQFQQLTKYVRDSMRRGSFRFDKQPPLRKIYPKPIQTLTLPRPSTEGGPPLWDAIRNRRSVRSYSAEALGLQELAQLLWAVQGITSKGQNFSYRSAPSAGALYPVETYLVVNRVEKLEPGLYHFDCFDAALQLLKQGALGGRLANAALGQSMMEEAAVVFIWTAIVGRSAWKYAERAYRYIYLDAGHIAQNCYLAATALNLVCCAVGAFFDEEVNEILEVDGVEETAIYLAAVGKAR